jgi:hypothetical protein
MHQLTVVKQFLVNFDLFDPQAVRHLDDVHAVKEASLFLLLRKVTHSDSFEWARMILLNGRAEIPSVPL